MQTIIWAIISFFGLIFIGSFIASILDLWLHQGQLTNYPKLRDLYRKRG
jgi:hypothetical protein